MEYEPEKYQTHFSDYYKRSLEPADNMGEMYKKVHAAMRADRLQTIDSQFLAPTENFDAGEILDD